MTDERAWLIRVGGADIPIRPGVYVIGRSTSCNVVLHSPSVSRRHARLVVKNDSATIEDLGSQNGVLVNNRPLPPGPHAIDPETPIVIGGVEVFLSALGPRRSANADRVTLASNRESEGFEPEASSVSTTQKDALEMVAPLVEKALREGRSKDADSMLHAHLGNVLDSLRRDRFVRDDTLRRALRYALLLAESTGRGRWLDYAFELLTRVRMPLDEALQKALTECVTRVDRVDRGRIQAYASAMKAGERGARDLRSVHQAERLLELLDAPKR